MNGRTLFGIIAATVISLGSAAQAQEVTLNLHHFLPPQSTVPANILDVWADAVEKDSGGRIQINRFPSMQLGGVPPELFDQAVDGVADIIWTVTGYTPGRFPRAEVFELPFFVRDSVAASSAYWKMHEKHMRDTEFADVHVLGTWVHGPGVIHAAKPIATPDDLIGVKARGASRMVNQLLGELGATPVGMPVPAIPEALSKGVVDAVTIPWEVTGSLKVPELVRHHTEFTGNMLYTLTFVLAMNKERYESLPDDLKAVVDANSGLELSIFAGQTQLDGDAPARAAAVAAGNTITTVTNTRAWEEKTVPVYDAWVAEMAEQGIDGQALIDEAKALMAAHGS